MTKFEDTIKKTGGEYSLSDTERTRMKRVLRDYMAFKPLPRNEEYSVSIFSGWYSFAHRPIAAALVLVLVFGSSVTYAAESALPGDVLYSIKTYVNEPTRVALATNAEAKAEVQIELAERRIEEATTLAAEGRLDDETQDDLAVAFEAHAAAVAEQIVEAETDDASAPVELSSRFENRLAAHEAVLTEVEIEAGVESEDADEPSHRLSDAIRKTSEVLAENRFNRSRVALNAAADTPATGSAEESEPAVATMTMSLAAETAPVRALKSAAPEQEPAPTSDRKTISRMKSAAEKSLKTAEKLLRSAKISADAKARAEGDIVAAHGLIDEGKEYLDDDMDAEAFAAFEESLRISEQASVYIKAAPVLEKARSRNSRRTSDSGKNMNIQISVPGSLEATVTVPVSAGTKPTEPDREAQPAKENEHSTSSNSGSGTNSVSGSTTIKLDISL